LERVIGHVKPVAGRITICASWSVAIHLFLVRSGVARAAKGTAGRSPRTSRAFQIIATARAANRFCASRFVDRAAFTPIERSAADGLTPP